MLWGAVAIKLNRGEGKEWWTGGETERAGGSREEGARINEYKRRWIKERRCESQGALGGEGGRRGGQFGGRKTQIGGRVEGRGG